MMRELAKSY